MTYYKLLADYFKAFNEGDLLQESDGIYLKTKDGRKLPKTFLYNMPDLFEVKEIPEFEDGEWVLVKIKARYPYDRYLVKYKKDPNECTVGFNTTTREFDPCCTKGHEFNDIQKADRETVESYLFSHAKKRFKGKNVKSLTTNYIGEGKIIEFEYHFVFDTLYIRFKEPSHKVLVYKQGTWAETVPDKPTVAGYTVEKSATSAHIGCESINKAMLEKVINLIAKYNLRLYFEDKDITNEVYNLKDKI